MPDRFETTPPREHGEPKPAGRPRNRTAIVVAGVLTTAALFLAVVVWGGMGLAGQWSGPSSDSPAASVDGFLTALLTDRDADAAAGYLCTSLSGDLNQALDVLDSLPASGEAGAMASFSWRDVTEVSVDDDVAVVTAEVTLDITGEAGTWTFAVVTGDPDDTWRICGVDTGSQADS